MVEAALKKHYPALDEEISQYICGVLGSPDDFQSSEDIFDAVGSFLVETSDNGDEEGVMGFCETLYCLLTGGGKPNKVEECSGGGDEVEGAKLLDAPVQLSTKLKSTDSDAVNSIWMVSSNEARKTVDQGKLDKAEAKLKQKQEKKAKDLELAKPKELVLSGPTTNQASSKQNSRVEASGGVVGDIKIENFDIAYGNNVLLSCADLNLSFGRRYGLVGRNGVGKTTLLRAIAARELQLPSHVTVLHVEQEVVGDDTTAVDSVLESDQERTRLLRRERELVGRTGRGSLSSPTSLTSPVGSPASPSASSEELAEVYSRLQEIDADSAPARAAGILAGLGFNPQMQAMCTRSLEENSGPSSTPNSSVFNHGSESGIVRAVIISLSPNDITRALVRQYATTFVGADLAIIDVHDKEAWPTTILLVSHDRAFMTNVCSDIIHLHSRSLTSYRGDYERFIRTKTEKLKNQQREYEAQMQYRQHLQDYIDRWRYNAKRAPQAQSKIKILEKLPELKPVQIEPDVVLKFPDVEKLSPPILQLSEVSFGYSSGGSQVFKDVNIAADFDSRIAMVGDNGSGKTTLVKLLTGELVPNDGYRSAHRNLRIAYFTQHHVDQLVMDVSPLELIKSRFPGKKDEEYRHQLGSFGVSGDLALRPIASLSGGQKSRLAFALLAMTRPNFLILDEPTNHLDVATVEALGKALSKFKGGVVLVSHDQHLIQLCATEVWLCKDQTVKRLEGGLDQYKTAVESEFRN